MSIHTEEKDWLEDLEAAYEGAEVGTAKVGDLLIDKMEAYEHGYLISTAIRDQGATHHGLRILKRAPEPKPELQAVMAGYVADDRFNIDPAVRHVWTSRGGGYWESIVDFVHSDELVDPAPLVELPAREELRYAVLDLMPGYRSLSGDIADAVLELLEGRV